MARHFCGFFLRSRHLSESCASAILSGIGCHLRRANLHHSHIVAAHLGQYKSCSPDRAISCTIDTTFTRNPVHVLDELRCDTATPLAHACKCIDIKLFPTVLLHSQAMLLHNTSNPRHPLPLPLLAMLPFHTPLPIPHMLNNNPRRNLRTMLPPNRLHKISLRIHQIEIYTMINQIIHARLHVRRCTKIDPILLTYILDLFPGTC